MGFSDSALFTDCGPGYGLYKWDGSAWTQLTTADPVNMVLSESMLYADFGTSGLYKWDGSQWIQLLSSGPSQMVGLD